MASEKRCGKSIGRGKHPVLRRDSCERFKSFLSKVVIPFVACEGVHANQGNRRDGICPRRGCILERLAANVETAHGGGIGRSIEKPPAFCVAVTSDSKVHRFLRGGKIARLERHLVSVQQSQYAENLVVE